MAETTHRLLTVAEAAEIFGVSRSRMYELARLGLVPSVRLGKQVRFSLGAIMSHIENGGKTLDGPGGWRRSIDG